MATIGVNIKRLRADAGLTQEQLAVRASVEQAQISKWERDEVTPDVSSLVRLAVGFGLPIDELVAEIDDEYELIRQKDGGRSGGRDRQNVDPVTRRFNDLWTLLTELQRTALVNHVGAMLGIAPDAAARQRGRGQTAQLDR